MIRIVAMNEAEFIAFRERAVPRRAERFAARGIWKPEKSLEASEALYQRLLPEGLATPHQHICHLVEESSGARVGEVWYSAETQAGVVNFWVHWIWIEPEFRRHGYATAAFHELDAEAVRMGAAQTGLDVWFDNPAAIQLYQKLGYAPASMAMVKRLVAPDSPTRSE